MKDYTAIIKKAFSMSLAKAQKNPLYLKGLNADGNHKLVPSIGVKFLIWNIPAVKTCPNATPHCIADCYAAKPEIYYPNCLPARERNFKESLQDDFVERMIFTIAANINRKSFRKANKIYFRIHESGDFYNRRYAAAWIEIAKAFTGVKNLVFGFYTKSFRYFLNENGKPVDLPENMVPTASVWDDTTDDQIERIKNLGWTVYTADTGEKVEKAVNSSSENYKCECKDCGGCHKCYDLVREIKNIYCIIH